jgi:hypothetical protein
MCSSTKQLSPPPKGTMTSHQLLEGFQPFFCYRFSHSHGVHRQAGADAKTARNRETRGISSAQSAATIRLPAFSLTAACRLGRVDEQLMPTSLPDEGMVHHSCRALMAGVFRIRECNA